MAAPRSRSRRAGPTDPAGWALVLLVAALSVAAGDRQAEQLRSWRFAYNQVHAPYRNAVARPDPTLTPWPAWVLDLDAPARRAVEAAGVGLLALGTGLAWLAVRRDRAIPALPCPRGRAGPGRVAAAITVGWMALATVAAGRAMAVDPHLPAPAGTWWAVPAATPAVFWPQALAAVDGLIPATIAAAWAYLAVAGRWRGRPGDSIELFGRWLGWAWVGLAASRRLAALAGLTIGPPFG